MMARSDEPQFVRVTESTCSQISLFKDVMKEYRKLDDSITMRLNRNNAQWRDVYRTKGDSRASLNQDEACEYFWKELVANWEGRKSIIDYCVDVVDRNITNVRQPSVSSGSSETSDRLLKARIYSEEVKRKQITQELSVESIIRRRSWEAFTSRCKHFEPPRSDVEARKWWDAAVTGRLVESPNPS